MTGNDTLLLVVTGRITSELKDLGREVLENSSEVDYIIDSIILYKKVEMKVDAPGAPAPTR